MCRLKARNSETVRLFHRFIPSWNTWTGEFLKYQINYEMRTIFDETKDYIVYHHQGVTRFTGCQCIKDCNCQETFISTPYDYYTVAKKFGKHKTTVHLTLESVNKRIELLLSVPNKRYHHNKET